MRALTVLPGKAQSAGLMQMPEPPAAAGSLLVATHAVGVCGTDLEIIAGAYGEAPAGDERLVIGHEVVGRVLEGPREEPIRAGDWVVGIVRRPDPEPCSSCAVGEWDMCRNDGYRERGIKGLHGFASDRFRLEPAFAVRVSPRLGELAVLLEPASVVAKAWDHIERIGRRAHFEPERVLITGAGPIGLLAALLAVQRGLHVEVLDRVSEGPKPSLVRDLGAAYHRDSLTQLHSRYDIVVECTGASSLLFPAIELLRPGGIVCLTGVSSRGRRLSIDAGDLNRELVLENNVVFGSVNANRAHYEQAAAALEKADRGWLERLITRRVPLERWPEAFERRPSDVKPILVFGAAAG